MPEPAPEPFELLARHAGLVTEVCSQLVLVLAGGGDSEVPVLIARLRNEGDAILRQCGVALRGLALPPGRRAGIQDLMTALAGALDALCQAAERVTGPTLHGPALDTANRARAVYRVVCELQVTVVELRKRQTPSLILGRCQVIMKLSRDAQCSLQGRTMLPSEHPEVGEVASLTDVDDLLATVADRCRAAAAAAPSIVL